MKNSLDKRKGWLRDLNSGDKVAVYFLPMHAASYGTEEEIENITPTGKIQLKTEGSSMHPELLKKAMTFSPNGKSLDSQRVILPIESLEFYRKATLKYWAVNS